MKLRASDKGFSLIETILATVILAVSFLSLVYVFTSTTRHSGNLDFMNTAVLLAHETMEQVTAKPFADVANIGTTSYGGNFNRYSFQVAVGYVNVGDLNTQVGGPTDYKRVTVTVTATGWTGTITLICIKGNV
jgi:prepilin-type N-terminal cleavage/methylation domain-containing protein